MSHEGRYKVNCFYSSNSVIGIFLNLALVMDKSIIY